MVDIVRETATKEYSWIKYMRQRISQNKNFMAVLTGQTGSGKTWNGISMCEMVDPTFNIDRIVFSGSDLMALINSGEIQKGCAILWDEAGVGISSRNWQSLANKMLNFLLQTFRHRNFILIFTTPYEDFVDSSTRKLLHAEFRTIKIDYKKKTCRVKGKLYQYNPELKKFYKKYLRIITRDGGVVPIVSWDVPKPSKKLIDQYEAKRSAFTQDLNQRIQKELEILEQKHTNKPKPPTQSQQEIIDCWKKGIFIQSAIAKELGRSRESIKGGVGFLKRKGIVPGDYQHGHPHQVNS